MRRRFYYRSRQRTSASALSSLFEWVFFCVALTFAIGFGIQLIPYAILFFPAYGLGIIYLRLCETTTHLIKRGGAVVALGALFGILVYIAVRQPVLYKILQRPVVAAAALLAELKHGHFTQSVLTFAPIYPFMPIAFAGCLLWLRRKSDKPTVQMQILSIVLLPIRLLTGAEWDSGPPLGSAQGAPWFRFVYAGCFLIGYFQMTHHSIFEPSVRDQIFLGILGAGFLYSLVAITWPKRAGNGGYIVVSGEFEHRMIAERVLQRVLEPHEVVHHINGVRNDNRVENLCVMHWEDHELFHSWLRWKREKQGYYPHFETQRRILVEQHRGILLDER